MKKKVANYRVIVEPDEEVGTGKAGFTAYVPKLGIADSGYSIEETLSNIKEGIRCWIEALLQDGEAIPEPDRVEADIVTTVSVEIPIYMQRKYQRSVHVQAL